MITDARRLRWRVPPLLLAAPAVLALWGAVVAAMTLLQPAGQAVAVFALGGPERALAAVIAADGAILEVRANAIVAASDDPAFVARLYRQGAAFVVSARGPGCGLGAAARLPRRPAIA
jgi:hypothetical protein